MSKWLGVLGLFADLVWVVILAPDFTIEELIIMGLLLAFSVTAISGAFEIEHD